MNEDLSASAALRSRDRDPTALAASSVARHRHLLNCERPEIQAKLNKFYLRELGEPAAYEGVPLPGEYPDILEIEKEWNAYEEARANLAKLPKTISEFKHWYASLYRKHRAEVAPFFEYLANAASKEQIAFYVALEEQVDGRFDDVIAIAQIGMAGDMKLALAENFWDEMGLGKLDEMHTTLFKKSALHMNRIMRIADLQQDVPAAAYKNGNLLLMYALRRCYAPRLLGALTILEHTAPYRFAKTVRGLRRIGVPEEAIYYHEMHIEVDANHGKQLFNRVLLPLLEQAPHTMREICTGCLIRFQVASDYYASINNAWKIDVNSLPEEA